MFHGEDRHQLSRTIPPEELERVVRRPAERARLRFESDLLVDDLLRDAGAGKGNLALLEFCLQELYRAKTDAQALNTPPL